MSVGDRKLDIFESMFRSAVHDRFELAPPPLRAVTVVSDLGPEATSQAVAHAKRLLSTIDHADQLVWTILHPEDWTGGIDALLTKLDATPTDLIVTWRQLRNTNHDLRWTLGSVVDSLTQARDIPVLLLPSPTGPEIIKMTGTQRVMVIADHVEGDHRLVNWGVHMTHKTGTLSLSHVEDEAALERVLNAIGKLPHLNSDVAREQLPAKLLQLASDYLGTVTGVLTEHQIQETVVSVVKLGHALTDYPALLEQHQIDLLILPGKDATQTAMHATAHALAVEVRDRPLLLL